VSPAAAQPWLSFRSTLGIEDVGGALGAVFEPAVRTEWTIILSPPDPMSFRPRFGVGLSRVTYGLESGYSQAVADNAHAEHWNHVTGHLMVGVVAVDPFAFLPNVDLYLEARVTRGRLRSQTHLKWSVTADPPRETPHDSFPVRGFEQVLGFKSDFGSLPLEVDLELRRGALHPSGQPSFDLSSYALGIHADGHPIGVQLGVHWRP
jgi:hypothetical protein